jgi:hypothetical protein
VRKKKPSETRTKPVKLKENSILIQKLDNDQDLLIHTSDTKNRKTIEIRREAKILSLNPTGSQ